MKSQIEKRKEGFEMYKVISESYGFVNEYVFKTEKRAWKTYSALYNHYLDNGNAIIKMMKNEEIIYIDKF